MYQSHPQDRINTQVIYRFALTKVEFYLTIVNKPLHHSHTWFARTVAFIKCHILDSDQAHHFDGPHELVLIASVLNSNQTATTT